MLSAARLSRLSRSPTGSYAAFSGRKMLHCLCRARPPASLQPAVARSALLAAAAMPTLLGPELRLAQQSPCATSRVWTRCASSRSRGSKDSFGASPRPKGGKFAGTPLRVQQAAARANRSEEQPPEDDDLVVLYSADDTMRKTYKFTGLLIIGLQLYMVIVTYTFLFSAAGLDSKLKDEAEAGATEAAMDDGLWQRLWRSPQFYRAVAVVNIAAMVLSYVVASRSSQNTLLSMVLRRTDRYVHIRTFPELADYPKRNCFTKSWLRDMPAKSLSVQPHRRSDRSRLVITYEDDQKRRLVMHNHFILRHDIWKELKLKVPEEK